MQPLGLTPPPALGEASGPKEAFVGLRLGRGLGVALGLRLGLCLALELELRLGLVLGLGLGLGLALGLGRGRALGLRVGVGRGRGQRLYRCRLTVHAKMGDVRSRQMLLHPDCDLTLKQLLNLWTAFLLVG